MEYRPLADFVELSQGLAVNKGTAHLFSDIKNCEFPYPLLRIVDFEAGIHDNYSKYVSKNISPSVIIDENTIVFTRVTCQCFRGFKGVLHNNLFVVNLISSELTEDYLFTVLQSEFVRKQALYFAQSSVVPDLNHKMFKEIRIPIPDKSTQEKIAKLYLNITNKIDNNSKINFELEAMARTIYDYWFLQFDFPDENGKTYKSSGGKMVWNEELKREIPEGWRVGNLSEIASIIMGSSPKGESLNEDKEGIIFYQGKTDFGYRFPMVRMYTNSPIRYAEVNDILLSVRAPVGDMNITSERCCIGRGLAAINSRYRSFLFYLMLSNQYQFDKYNNKGTTFGAITKEELFGLRVVITDAKIIEIFDKKISDIDKKIFSNEMQNQELTSLRDFLLPLLMNGQVGFKEQ